MPTANAGGAASSRASKAENASSEQSLSLYQFVPFMSRSVFVKDNGSRGREHDVGGTLHGNRPREGHRPVAFAKNRFCLYSRPVRF